VSIAVTPSSTPVAQYSTRAVDPGADFEKRWNAWKARGLEHERAVTHRFVTVAILVGTIAMDALAYRVLFP
jgi:hypothetical protein